MIKIAHRGFRVDTEENTFNAFDKAVELSMDYIECDIRLTKDKKMVIIHDGTINRTFKGRGKVRRKKLQKLKKYRTKIKGRQIPTLEETLRKYSPEIMFMLEIKDHDATELLADFVKSNGYNNRVVFSGRSPKEFMQIKSIIPNARFCYNITNAHDFTEADLLKTEKTEDLPIFFDMISLTVNRIASGYIEKCHELGIEALCWNLIAQKEPIARIKELIEMGIDGVLFDDPLVAKNF